jgi:molybdate transport system substrate-binding protein
MKNSIVLLAFALSSALNTLPAFGAELRLYAAAGVKVPLVELAAEFEKAHNQKVDLVFDTAGAAEKRFLADTGATFLITTRTLIQADIKAGHLPAGEIRDVGQTVAGFAAPPGAPHPDISTAAKLKAALLAAPRIVFSDPARGATAGMHFVKIIDAFGIKDEIMKKSVLAVDGIETMKIILAGGADLGVTQLSEVVQADHTAVVGPFPPEFDLASTYSLWDRPDAPAVAKDFATFLVSDTARAKFAEHGLRAPVQKQKQ